ncbi:hypothetical protein PsAD2_04651 [Pseudovibrio axinellae]|uniref:Uncharacterized protein n=1 Tax=Pseudovibrio axinellae TaxID=989403 RepID=A0A165SWE9_9HYPH|nr:hypothetical protein [Pseudovibrio axinellae]KZL04568.1 hypothetical protein PsAD2_04651 [Pseudovibrio axinellae]SEQ72769.1 hypothetical protein SAMN05421798_10457 [Pseudovibrio axinellae]
MYSTDQTILKRALAGMSFSRIAAIYGVTETYIAALYSAAKGLPSAFPDPDRERRQQAKCAVFFEMPPEAQDIVLEAKLNNNTSLDAIFQGNNNTHAAATARMQVFHTLNTRLNWSVPTISIHTQFSEKCIRDGIKTYHKQRAQA